MPIIDFSMPKKEKAENNFIDERYAPNYPEIGSGTDRWFSVGDGYFIIPCNDLTLVYHVSSTASHVHLLANPLEELLSLPNLTFVLRSQLPNAQEIGLTHAKASHDNGKSCPPKPGNAFHLMLSLTTNCNLECTYCYIRGGTNQVYMPWNLAQSAIDYAVAQCVTQGLQNISLAFHGEGEPTLNWNVLSRAVDRFQTKCREHDLQGTVSLTTNGLISTHQIQFLQDNKIHTTISMDSHTNSLNLLRPMRNGRSLLPNLLRTLRKCELQHLDFSIRSTVTPLNVKEMKEFVLFLEGFKHCMAVQFEPLAAKGRACEVQLDDAFYETFVEHFFDARTVGICVGLEVVHASSQLSKKRKTFCHAVGKDMNFCVSADGIVSSCYEHLDSSAANKFFYGRYEDGSFEIIRDASIRLECAGGIKSECKTCYLASTCAGDCYADKDKYGRRCYINRQIAKRELLFLCLGNIIVSESKAQSKEDNTNEQDV